MTFLQSPKNAALLNGIGNFIQGNFGLILAGVVAAGAGLLTIGTALSTATLLLRAAQFGLGIGPSVGAIGRKLLANLGLKGSGVGKIAQVGGQTLMNFFIRRGRGGIVPGSGSNDTVPAMLTPGEVVISKPAAQKFGVSNLLAINASAGAKSKPIVKNHVIHANEGGVIPAGFPDVGNLIKVLVGTAEQLPNSPLGKTLSNPEIPKALQGVAESFAIPKSQQKNMGQNIMNIVGSKLGGKLDTTKMEGVMKEFPNLTPPNIIKKLNEKGAFEDLNDFIQRLSNPNKIDEKGFENELDEISFFKSPKEKWLTYGAVV